MLPLKLSIPVEVSTTHNVLIKAGYEAYLVGGCVRDLLLKKEPKDWDITTNATPGQIQELFANTFYENDYGTVGIVTESGRQQLKVIEVTPFRTEGTYSNTRHPDTVSFTHSLSEDLKRRDFTINALAYDPIQQRVVDDHEGIKDLERRVITCVGDPHERFAEDALRMMRAIRLSAELDFALDGETAVGIAKHAALLTNISGERIRDELIRILESDRPMQALYVAQKLGILKYTVPELEEGIGCNQNQAHSFDVFEHLLRSLQHAADKKWPLEVRIAALFHDIGKPATREWSETKKDWTFYGHDVVGARITRTILSRLRFSNEMIDKVTLLIRWHMFFSDTDKITLSAVRRLVSRVGTHNIKDLVNLRVCDRIGTGRPKEHPFRLRKYMSMIDEAMRDPISVSMLALNGNDVIKLGQDPGPRIGWILHALLEEVLDDPTKNTKEYLSERTLSLKDMPENELRILGERGKDRKDEEDDEAIKKLRTLHHVN